ncbi:Hint domain-containing protein [Shimia sp. SDUM112013]|uniref:Hint domain-containing protein n=1 Tax=Shimia sp. SDUM112013 TaxID=3136160 RepID=UPI0032EE5CA8
MSDPKGPGVVDGTENDDLIDATYTDADGDSVTSGDDIVVGGSGSDTIDALEGNDTIIGDGNCDTVVERHVIDFNDLAAGTLVEDQYPGVQIFSFDGNTPTMIFDTSNPTGDDDDLATDNLGGVLIMSEDGDSSDPDDNADGGSIGFRFDEPVSIESLTFLDIEEGATVRFFDDAGELIGEVAIDPTDDNGQLVYEFDEVYRVSKMIVDLPGSGAIDDLTYATLTEGDPIIGGDDDITGGDGQDVIYGNDGDDTIDSSSGEFAGAPDLGFPSYMGLPEIEVDDDPDNDRDYVEGGAGNDVIFTGDDSDTIDGGTGNDDINAGLDADIVAGGEGDDTIIGGEGSDTVDGGEGNDLIYGGLGDGFPDTLNIPDDGSVGDPDPVTDNGRDLLIGGAGDDTIFGQDDDDTIEGGDGEDVIDAGIDDDVVSGGAGIDIISGGQGDDLVQGNEDTDLVLGGEGDDSVTGGEGSDIVAGGEGDDYVTGDEGVDLVFGGAGEDTLIGGSDSDLIVGGADGDLVYGDGVANDGNTADGAADLIVGGAGADTVYGGTGADVIDGGEGADELSGGADRDVFVEVGVGDHIDGGELGDDFDTLVISGNALIEYDPLDPEAGTITYYDLTTLAPIGTATFENIENVIYVEDLPNPEDFLAAAPSAASSTSTTVTATSGDTGYPPDYTTSTPGQVDGTDGPDLIVPGYSDAGGETVDALASGVPGATTNDDTIVAYGGDDTVDAGLGDDEVLGGDGADELFGNDGDDIMRGDDGDDTVSGGAGFDQLSGDAGDDSIIGGEGDDILEGGDGNDTLEGGEGNDGLYGGAGDDSLDGGPGNDLLAGGAGNDTINLGFDTVGGNLAAGGDDEDTFLGGGPGSLVFGGEGGVDNDTLDLRGTGVPGGSFTITYNPADPTFDPATGRSESGIVTYFDAGGTEIGTMAFSEIENVICFTPGTAILTPAGEVPVQDLKVGDKVVTRDNGLQTIRWIGKKRLSGRSLIDRPNLRPVMIRAGALGPDLPERDMMVSPNHRMLLVGAQPQLMFEEREVLAAAKHLTHFNGVHQVETGGVEYVHFLCDNHEVVLANGAWSESFQPGEYSMGGIGLEQQQEIYEIFPELRSQKGLENYSAARLTLKRHEAELLG